MVAGIVAHEPPLLGDLLPSVQGGHMAEGPAPAVPAVIGLQAVHQRGLGGFLQRVLHASGGRYVVLRRLEREWGRRIGRFVEEVDREEAPAGQPL